MLKSGFVVCFYRLEEKADDSTDKVRINMDRISLPQKKIIDYIIEHDQITNKEVEWIRF
jgi:hypothetical protein